MCEPPLRWIATGAVAQIGLLAALAAGVGLSAAAWTAGALYTVAAATLLGRAARGRIPGPADAVTSVRVVLLGGVMALTAQAGPPWPLVVLATAALALDLVDGAVARRTGTASDHGARYDMEVDAFALVVLGAHVAADLGPWVLLVGAARYVFWAASVPWPWLKAPLPDRLSRKAVAALQGVALVVAAAPVVPVWASAAVVGCALAALVWSFGRDARWLWLRRPPAEPGPAATVFPRLRR
ncbi:CDP-alcohol phosphatidyltransferase family protein [Nocardiopsis xinjiangensis]|uniref:CDP-alcohol phosphatidyltransferase family protein n=1 Tax=Nocardiopsis xinjiangensis TaxID=124285 RepID=UPI000686FCC5|nr:CDP-alcohol phosphatidyltransferase family protein [Nocardiopsis xinjiangensis]